MHGTAKLRGVLSIWYLVYLGYLSNPLLIVDLELYAVSVACLSVSFSNQKSTIRQPLFHAPF